MRNLAIFLSAVAILIAAVVLHTSRLFGYDLSAVPEAVATDVVADNSAQDAPVVINTTETGRNIIGYAGPVPLEVTFDQGKITAITVLPNDETPPFMQRVEEGLGPQFLGMSVADAAAGDVDCISRATYTSKAYIANIQLAANAVLASANPAEVAESQPVASTTPARPFEFSFAWLAALVVAIAGAVVPLFVKSRAYRIAQLIADFAILGVWCATMLNFYVFTNLIANGMASVLTSAAIVVMLITAFIFPYFGHANHYCNWICPFGAMQELAGRLNPWVKIRLSEKTVKRLNFFRQALWVILLLSMFNQVCYSWFEYEPFSVFSLQSAGVFVIIVSAAVVVLSLFISRPYCRFVCPTGSFLKSCKS